MAEYAFPSLPIPLSWRSSLWYLWEDCILISVACLILGILDCQSMLALRVYTVRQCLATFHNALRDKTRQMQMQLQRIGYTKHKQRTDSKTWTKTRSTKRARNASASARDTSFHRKFGQIPYLLSGLREMAWIWSNPNQDFKIFLEWGIGVIGSRVSSVVHT